MQFYRGAAVLQLIGFLHRRERKFAFLANGHKADVELVGHHSAQNKATSVQSRHHIGAHVSFHVAVHKGVDQHAKYPGVLQQRCDVTKLHTRRGPVLHGTDVVPKVLRDTEVLHGLVGLHEPLRSFCSAMESVSALPDSTSVSPLSNKT